MSGAIGFVMNGLSLTEEQSIKGKVVGGLIGGIGGGIGANLGKDFFPALNGDFAFYGCVVVGASMGWIFLGGWLGLADTLTTF